ncbi:hypothetical protein BM1_00097 [Bipolaris maydis]|nr:hypothetical protein BM1_00097 [Bipolaris maydis]
MSAAEAARDKRERGWDGWREGRRGVGPGGNGRRSNRVKEVALRTGAAVCAETLASGRARILDQQTERTSTQTNAMAPNDGCLGSDATGDVRVPRGV